MPDFEDSYFINISERAKALIEQLEPGRHQFLPIDYERKNGTLVERRYMFVICNRNRQRRPGENNVGSVAREAVVACSRATRRLPGRYTCRLRLEPA
jgi:hypothetical protein